jgi:hypothetical protein
MAAVLMMSLDTTMSVAYGGTHARLPRAQYEAIV